MNRRRILEGGGIVASILLAGCSSGDDSNNARTKSSPTDSPTQSTQTVPETDYSDVYDLAIANLSSREIVTVTVEIDGYSRTVEVKKRFVVSEIDEMDEEAKVSVRVKNGPTGEYQWAGDGGDDNRNLNIEIHDGRIEFDSGTV